ncbi:MAG: Asp-tRNA(Asn)/Glu-tRNA(Gln) amidotransferase subunit GatB [Minisyncoccia bacterium]
MKLIPKIGLEIHLELKTKTKIFCRCPNDPNEIHPNTNICEICTGQPGTLPSFNKKVLEYAIMLGKALNCEINKFSYFVRKNYFYPDLPKNYQISQYELPLCKDGYLKIKNGKKIRIRRVHIEEDTGRLVHIGNESFVDFNRAGIPLLEIVTEPDIESSEEAKSFAEELILIAKYLGISDASPEKGEIRFEANISIAPEDSKELGTKVEVKNLGSLRSLRDAIDFEIERQMKLFKEGKEIIRETRGFDEGKRITFSQRWKEEAEDYRYFPEPDLPPIILSDEYIESIQIKELPEKRRERFQAEYNLSPDETEIFIKNKELGDFYEKTYSELKAMMEIFDTKLLYNILVNDVLGLLEKYEKELIDLDFKPYDLALLLNKLQKDEISIKILKDILKEVIEKNESVKSLLEKKKVLKDENMILELIEEVVKENPKAVDDYKKGKEGVLQFFIGELLKKTKGQIDINIAKDLLIKRLKE